MKFLVDAQLPARLTHLLTQAGHDAVHTSQLPDGNRTPDPQITELADEQGRVVVTKDRDFRNGHLLARSPQRLLVIATGNITNAALLTLLEKHLDAISMRSTKPISSSSPQTHSSCTGSAKTRVRTEPSPSRSTRT